MRVTETTFTVREIETDVEFVDDHDLTLAAVPESATVVFRGDEFASMTLIGRDKAGFYSAPMITDWEGLSEPWRSVAESIVKACKI